MMSPEIQEIIKLLVTGFGYGVFAAFYYPLYFFYCLIVYIVTTASKGVVFFILDFVSIAGLTLCGDVAYLSWYIGNFFDSYFNSIIIANSFYKFSFYNVTICHLCNNWLSTTNVGHMVLVDLGLRVLVEVDIMDLLQYPNYSEINPGLPIDPVHPYKYPFGIGENPIIDNTAWPFIEPMFGYIKRQNLKKNNNFEAKESTNNNQTIKEIKR